MFLGRTYIGLLQSCLEIYSGQQSEMCFTPVPQRTEWLLTFACIILGILSVTSTIGLLILSHWKYRVMKHARWLGFVASKYFSVVSFKTWFNSVVSFKTWFILINTITVIRINKCFISLRFSSFIKPIYLFSVILFCLAAVIFPIGFNMEQIGGEPYQLPNNYQVGISYIFFVLALWITVVSELFASKVCLPHF